MPFFRFRIACISSSLVFIMIGQCQATSFWMGRPNTQRNRTPSGPRRHGDFVARIEPHERPVAAHVADVQFLAGERLVDPDPFGRRGVPERARSGKDVRVLRTTLFKSPCPGLS